MHLSLDAQARGHVDHLRAALPEAWRGLAIASHAAPEGLAQRTRSRVHVHCGRSGHPVVGMHETGTHEPVEVDRCAVLDPGLEQARRGLARVFAGSRGRGDVQLALGAERRPVLDVRWTGELAREAFARLEDAVTAGSIAGARVKVGDMSRPARIGDPTPWMNGADGLPLCLAAGGFGQASNALNTLLVRHVADLVRPWEVKKAVELYAGAGNLSVLLAQDVAELACVESSREACDAARANLAARPSRGDIGRGARVVEADADTYEWGAATRLVVLDPPRTGARAVAERLKASRVQRVVYVSCDTQTLGRDLAILEGAYAPVSADAFEMFPQTSHVEVVIALERKRPGAQP
jgi:23S rRNA (uracil1939-C5)-methyltransferase